MTRATTAATSAPELRMLQLPTPAGQLTVLLDAHDDVVRAAGFCPTPALLARLPSGTTTRGRLPALGRVADAVAAYSDGDLTALGAVDLAQDGGGFTRRAWAALRALEPGTTTTYAALAAAAGNPAAVRAAGGACARNLIAVFIPCHRVLTAAGATGGYLYGAATKQALLTHERS